MEMNPWTCGLLAEEILRAVVLKLAVVVESMRSLNTLSCPTHPKTFDPVCLGWGPKPASLTGFQVLPLLLVCIPHLEGRQLGNCLNTYEYCEGGNR